jgi:hypothetical protein
MAILTGSDDELVIRRDKEVSWGELGYTVLFPHCLDFCDQRIDP